MRVCILSEVHPGGEEPGHHHQTAQTVQLVTLRHRPDELEVCGGSAEGVQEQGLCAAVVCSTYWKSILNDLWSR